MVIRRRPIVPRTVALTAASVSPLAHAEGFSGLDEPLAIVWVTDAVAQDRWGNGFAPFEVAGRLGTPVGRNGSGTR